MKVAIKTLGCRTNQAEGEVLKEELQKSGFEIGKEEESDIFILNTCTVTSEADRKCRKLLHRAKKRGQFVLVTGCYAQREGKSLLGEGADLVVSQMEKEKIPQILKEKYGAVRKEDGFQREVSVTKAKAYLKVQDGCNHFCTYCIVPFVRGRERSVPLGEVVKRASELVDKGFKEIVLTGIRLGRYGREMGTSLVELLKNLLKIPGDVRFRLSSLDLKDIPSDLIEMMSLEEKLCPHLHIPLQSGSRKILKLMNRPYEPDDFLNLVEICRKKIPNFALSTDVLVGFPGESDGDFKKTIKVLKEARPFKIHTFIFSPRPYTKAALLEDKTPLEVKRERSRVVRDLESKIFLEEARNLLGSFLTVLVEEREGSFYKGTTENYFKVKFKGGDVRIGELRKVKLEKILEREFLGELQRGEENERLHLLPNYPRRNTG